MIKNKLAISLLPAIFVLAVSCNTQTTPVEQAAENTSNLEYLMKIKKIDVHTHVKSEQQYLNDFMDDWNFKYCTVCTTGSNPKSLQAQIDTAKMLYHKDPRHYAWMTTFDVSNRDEPAWADAVISQLKDDFEQGAVGVKVWKSIGMEYKKSNGDYLQLDDPIFTPIFEFIEQEGKTLMAHMGEPIHAWMPTYTTKDGFGRNYWAKHPEYSFWDKPELPSYSDIMAARDHVLERHPDLKFVGAHLGSLEFDVDEMITRTRYFMWQARGKVYDFFVRYQDRIMYGTDRGSRPVMTAEQKEQTKKEIEFRNKLFFRYYATSDEIPWGNVIASDRPRPQASYHVTGLNLPKEVLEKVFYKNAVYWFPGIDKDF